jgi:hypothetical protein
MILLELEMPLNKWIQVTESFSAGGMSAEILNAEHLGLEYEVGEKRSWVRP